jgi:hypothetical protein
VGKGKRLRGKRATTAATVPTGRVSAVSSLPPTSRGSELKLAHGQDHLQEISDLVQGWLKACFKTLREEPDPDEPGYYCAWIDAPEIDAQRLSLLVGDCLQAFRSTLDHLAFELASAFTIPMTDAIEKDSSFPILSDEDRTGFGRGPHKWTASKPKVRGMDPRAQAEIERLQPYHRGHAYDTDPLWRLGELNNVDKHRVLHVVQRVMTGAMLPINGPNLPQDLWSTNVAAIARADGQPFVLDIKGDIAAEGRTLVARWPMLPIDPSKPMRMNFRPALDVVFEPGTPLVAEAPILEVLREINDHVVSRVLPPFVAFLE